MQRPFAEPVSPPHRTAGRDRRTACPAHAGLQGSAWLEAVLSLPAQYKSAMYLHYYEGYTTPEISRILGKSVNTVYTLLTRAKKMLKEKLGGAWYEGDQ